jgi:hypothetical protein
VAESPTLEPATNSEIQTLVQTTNSIEIRATWNSPELDNAPLVHIEQQPEHPDRRKQHSWLEMHVFRVSISLPLACYPD